LASVGGLLGLIAGVSIISLVEVFYFLITICYQKLVKLCNAARIHPELIQPIRREAWKQDKDDNRLLHYLIEFFNESSVHGVNKIVEKDQKAIGKFLWTIIVLISFFTCCALIGSYAKNSETDPVAFELDEKLWSIEEVRRQILIDLS
jgi:hypothetical protein